MKNQLFNGNILMVGLNFHNYIEEQFIWEKTKYDAIDACQSIDELKAFIQNEHI